MRTRTRTRFSRRLSLLPVLAMLVGLLAAMSLTASAATEVSAWAENYATADVGTTEDNPYIIKTAAQLKAFAAYVNEGNTCENKYIKLDPGFDNSSAPLTTPIGSQTKKFMGTFDGNGKLVNLNIPSIADAGLFGWLSNGTIKNVGTSGSVTGAFYAGGVVGRNEGGTVTNCYAAGDVDGGLSATVGGVVGYSSGTVTNCYAVGDVVGGLSATVGGVVGYSSGTVTNCYATGDVSDGSDASVGGVVGYSSGTVTNCYATGDIYGSVTSYVGGVAGRNDGGTITNCYATGAVIGGDGAYVGGVAGYNKTGNVTSCYYKKGIAAYGVGAAGGVAGTKITAVTSDEGTGCTALPANQMTAAAGAGSGEGWVEIKAGNMASAEKLSLVDALNAGRAALTSGKPAVWVQSGSNYPTLATPDTGWYTGGDYEGTEEDPYIIKSTLQLEGLAELVNSGTDSFDGKFIMLASDGDFTTTALVTPIGSGTPFKGTFDGSGKLVNLNIRGYNQAGLFGYLYHGTIKNVGTSGSVTGKSYAGGVVGYSSGTVTNCYATGAVTGGSFAQVGGVAGSNEGGTITNCYATGDVIGGTYSCVGGVVGYGYGAVTSCYATGAVTGGGGSCVGGVIGSYFGSDFSNTVTNCYATGNVKGGYSAYVGGVAGCNDGGAVTSCYATGAVDGGSNAQVGGVVGYSSGTVTNCYATGDVDGGSNAEVGGVVGYSNDTVTNCYATGAVIGGADSYVGGVVGYNKTGDVTSCYYKKGIAAYGFGAAGTGTTAVTSDEGTGCTALPANQMTAAAGAGSGEGWVEIKAGNMASAEKLSLVDALNAYVKANPTISLRYWAVDSRSSGALNDGYPLYGWQVTYVGNGEASRVSAPDYVLNGACITKPDDPVWTGYVFKGWYKEAACTNIWDFNSDHVTGNVTLYAKWMRLLTAAAADFDFTPAGDLVYSGVEKPATVAPKAAIDGMGNITVYYSDDGGATWTATPVNAGTYLVKIDVAKGTMYKAAEGITDEAWVFTIIPKTLNADNTIIDSIPQQLYTGGGICPDLTIMNDGKTLKAGTDYTVTYIDNKQVGTATVFVTFIGNYSGDMETTFTIYRSGGERVRPQSRKSSKLDDILKLIPEGVIADVPTGPLNENPAVVVSTQKMTINGKAVTPAAYNCDGYNYFKIRDLCDLLTQAGYAVNVTYDENAQTVSITIGEGYAAIGGEQASVGTPVKVVVSSQSFVLNGNRITFSTYNIDGYNYVNLRQFCAALGISVSYDEDSRTMQLVTK